MGLNKDRLTYTVKETIEAGVNVVGHTTFGFAGGFLIGEVLTGLCTPAITLKRVIQNRPLMTPEDFISTGILMSAVGALVFGGDRA